MQIISFLVGIALGALGLHYYYVLHPEESPGAELSVIDKGRIATEQKLEEWHLTAPEVKEDLAEKGKVVRKKAEDAGRTISQTFSNARIHSVIKAKYTLDKDLSARAIEVEVKEGHVRLSGHVPSAQLISKAVALAMDTDGVVQVESNLAVRTDPASPVSES